jgi:hypothetical protein
MAESARSACRITGSSSWQARDRNLRYVFIPISFFARRGQRLFMLSFFLVAVLYGTILSVGALLLRKHL